jgi:hypothetical protein
VAPDRVERARPERVERALSEQRFVDTTFQNLPKSDIQGGVAGTPEGRAVESRKESSRERRGPPLDLLGLYFALRPSLFYAFPSPHYPPFTPLSLAFGQRVAVFGVAERLFLANI